MRISDWSSDVCSSDLAAFHRDTLPQVKAEWIDSGRARLVFRHYPLDQLPLRAAAAANCMQGPAFFGFMDVLFKHKEQWASSNDRHAAASQSTALRGLAKPTSQNTVDDRSPPPPNHNT